MPADNVSSAKSITSITPVGGFDGGSRVTVSISPEEKWRDFMMTVDIPCQAEVHRGDSSVRVCLSDEHTSALKRKVLTELAGLSEDEWDAIALTNAETKRGESQEAPQASQLLTKAYHEYFRTLGTGDDGQVMPPPTGATAETSTDMAVSLDGGLLTLPRGFKRLKCTEGPEGHKIATYEGGKDFYDVLEHRPVEFQLTEVTPRPPSSRWLRLEERDTGAGHLYFETATCSGGARLRLMADDIPDFRKRAETALSDFSDAEMKMLRRWSIWPDRVLEGLQAAEAMLPSGPCTKVTPTEFAGKVEIYESRLNEIIDESNYKNLARVDLSQRRNELEKYISVAKEAEALGLYDEHLLERHECLAEITFEGSEARERDIVREQSEIQEKLARARRLRQNSNLEPSCTDQAFCMERFEAWHRLLVMPVEMPEKGAESLYWNTIATKERTLRLMDTVGTAILNIHPSWYGDVPFAEVATRLSDTLGLLLDVAYCAAHLIESQQSETALEPHSASDQPGTVHTSHAAGDAAHSTQGHGPVSERAELQFRVHPKTTVRPPIKSGRSSEVAAQDLSCPRPDASPVLTDSRLQVTLKVDTRAEPGGAWVTLKGNDEYPLVNFMTWS